MRILHLSDTHLFADPATRHYDRIATADALCAVLEGLEGLGDIDLIVHSGDASDDGTVASYRALHAMLDPFAERLGAPLAIAMGNHDTPTAYAEVAGPGDHAAPFQDRVIPTAAGGRAIVLDTTVPGRGYGRLEQAQLDWLGGTLAEPAIGGTVIVMHHPPLVAATALLRGLDLQRREALADVLQGADVQVILSGHYHHPMDGEIAGIPVHVAPGITGVVDPLTAGEHERALALSGASIVEVEPGRICPPRITTSLWANAGDAREDVTDPIYDFGPEQVRDIVEASGA